jgi:hypothetical protein
MRHLEPCTEALEFIESSHSVAAAKDSGVSDWQQLSRRDANIVLAGRVI